MSESVPFKIFLDDEARECHKMLPCPGVWALAPGLGAHDPHYASPVALAFLKDPEGDIYPQLIIMDENGFWSLDEAYVLGESPTSEHALALLDWHERVRGRSNE